MAKKNATETKKATSAKRATAKATKSKPAPKKDPVSTGDPEELCVFAMRLTRGERDLIHAAAGSGKASRFVRSVAVAAASGDKTALEEALAMIKQD